MSHHRCEAPAALGSPIGYCVAFALLCAFAGAVVPSVQAQQQASPLVRSLQAPLPLPMQTFQSGDYQDGSGQNWSVVSGSDGRVYVGNNSGVLTYDGAHWLPPVPMDNGGIARTLLRLDDERILVGGVSELGILETRPGRVPAYRSLTASLPDSLQGFGDLWRGEARGDDAAFELSDHLMFFDGATDAVTLWPKPHVSTRVVHARDTLFVVTPTSGDPIWIVEDGALVETNSPLGPLLRRHGCRYGARIGDTDYLLGTDALVAVGPRTVRLLDAFPIDEVTRSWPYGMAAAPGGALIVSTIENGAFVTDTEGRMLRRIDRAAGLPENVTQCAYVDSAGALWLCHDIGVSRVQLLAPLRTYDGPGVPVSTNQAVLVGDTLIAASAAGVTALLAQVRRH